MIFINGGGFNFGIDLFSSGFKVIFVVGMFGILVGFSFVLNMFLGG